MGEQAEHTEPRRYTVDEYFALEESSETRHEFIDGQILDMSGGTYAHVLIASHVIGELHARLQGKPCRAHGSNLRIRYGRRVLYGYPDAMVVCGEPQFDPKNRNTLLNPKVIFEVISESTEAFDRGKKSVLYREIESLGDYVSISQDEPNVEIITRQSDGTWLIHSYRDLNAEARLVSLELKIPLREIYAGVEFPPPPSNA